MFGIFIVILGIFVSTEVWRAPRAEGGSIFNGRLAGQIILFTVIAVMLLLAVTSIISWLNLDIRGAV